MPPGRINVGSRRAGDRCCPRRLVRALRARNEIHTGGGRVVPAGGPRFAHYRGHPDRVRCQRQRRARGHQSRARRGHMLRIHHPDLTGRAGAWRCRPDQDPELHSGWIPAGGHGPDLHGTTGGASGRGRVRRDFRSPEGRDKPLRWAAGQADDGRLRISRVGQGPRARRGGDCAYCLNATCLPENDRWQVLGQSVRGRSGLIEFATSDGSGRLWVSASTFLPSRLVETTPRPPYAPVIVTFVFKFLPPTAANRAMLTVPIPAGFSEVALPG